MTTAYVSALSVVRYCTAPGCGLRLSVADVDLCVMCVEAGRKPDAPSKQLQKWKPQLRCACNRGPVVTDNQCEFCLREREQLAAKRSQVDPAEYLRRKTDARRRSQGTAARPVGRPRGSAGS